MKEKIRSQQNKVCKNCGGLPSVRIVNGEMIMDKLDSDGFCSGCYWAKMKNQNFTKQNLTKIPF